jgi:hypothetical protein
LIEPDDPDAQRLHRCTLGFQARKSQCQSSDTSCHGKLAVRKEV